MSLSNVRKKATFSWYSFFIEFSGDPLLKWLACLLARLTCTKARQSSSQQQIVEFVIKWRQRLRLESMWMWITHDEQLEHCQSQHTHTQKLLLWLASYNVQPLFELISWINQLKHLSQFAQVFEINNLSRRRMLESITSSPTGLDWLDVKL